MLDSRHSVRTVNANSVYNNLMPRKLLPLLAIALFALTASAERTRSVASGKRSTAATVYGVVTSVEGNVIRFADGLVAVDATDAKIVAGRGGAGTMADVTPGALVFATLRDSAAGSGPLPAEMIAVTRIAAATLFGSVDSVDVAGRTITMLGRAIHVTDETSFGGLRGDKSLGLDDVFADQLVQIETEAQGGKLVATSVMILTPMAPPQVVTIRGTVKSIAADAWVIETKKESLALRIEPQTKIAGSPSVGDEVEVLYRVDSSNANVAIAIVRIELPTDPFVKRVTGTIDRIEGDTWTIGGVAVKVTRDTKIEPFLRVGDTVEALVERRSDGTLVALAIVKKRW
jgi:exosome complex RNA-binding protein Csl4